jgi:hypothetical protein
MRDALRPGNATTHRKAAGSNPCAQGAQPIGRGATRSRPLPASMASGVERIAAPRGTFQYGAPGTVAGGLRAPQTPAGYLSKEIGRAAPLTVLSLSTNG